jgi:hypothetical protein
MTLLPVISELAAAEATVLLELIVRLDRIMRPGTVESVK